LCFLVLVVFAAPARGGEDDLVRLAGRFGALYRDGRYAEAEKTAEEVVSLLERRGGRDADVAANLNNLGSLAVAERKLDAAEAWYKRALDLYRAAVGPAHPDVADVLSNLAGLAVRQGKLERAEALYQECLKIREKALGADDPSVAEALNNLGFLYLNSRRYETAEQVLRRAALVWQKSFNAETAPLAAVTLNNVGVLRFRQNRPVEAQAAYEAALSLEEKAFGSSHPETARTLENLAELYLASGRKEDGVRSYQRALAILEKALGAGDPRTHRVARRLEEIGPDGAARSGLFQIILARTLVEAEALLDRISKGETFDEVARAHSIDPSAPERGYFRAKLPDLREELRRQLEKLAQGQVSGVFECNGAWAIVRKVQEP
jgi:tetratricopeptide (TPR) repeat protein